MHIMDVHKLLVSHLHVINYVYSIQFCSTGLSEDIIIYLY